jgi:hypothetical protein
LPSYERGGAGEGRRRSRGRRGDRNGGRPVLFPLYVQYYATQLPPLLYLFFFSNTGDEKYSGQLWILASTASSASTAATRLHLLESIRGSDPYSRVGWYLDPLTPHMVLWLAWPLSSRFSAAALPPFYPPFVLARLVRSAFSFYPRLRRVSCSRTDAPRFSSTCTPLSTRGRSSER